MPNYLNFLFHVSSNRSGGSADDATGSSLGRDGGDQVNSTSADHEPSAPQMRERMTSAGLQEEICPICLVPFRSQSMPPPPTESQNNNTNSSINGSGIGGAASNIPVETNCGHLFCGMNHSACHLKNMFLEKEVDVGLKVMAKKLLKVS